MKALVIVVNRCQPAYLGCYGNDWLATPALDQLAAESVVFDQHFAERASPGAARWSWMNGRHFGAPALPEAEPLACQLWNAGARAVFIGDERSPSCSPSCSPGRLRGFGRGWEEQHWVRAGRLAEVQQDSLLGGTVQTAIEWLQAHRQADNWLLWLELGALQLPWSPAEHDREALEGLDEAEVEPWFNPPIGRIGQEINAEDAERLSPTYAGLVSGVDQWLGTLLDSLREAGLYQELLLVLTGDCGLPLGEHDLVGDAGPCLYEEQVHLPLLLHLPANAEAGRRLHQLTQPVDLLPTLLEGFGLPRPERLHGKSLLPVARGEPVKLREYACSAASLRGVREWAIRTHQWHLILPDADRPKLFVKPDDRWEVNDVAGQHPDLAEHLELALRRFQAALRTDRLEELPGLRETVLHVTQR